MHRLAIVVATVGRPEVVRGLTNQLELQIRPRDTLVLSVESDADLPSLVPPGAIVLTGPRGASAQRNRGIEQCVATHDVILFLDDDFVIGRDFLSATVALFQKHPELDGVTGLVLADGVGRGGLSQAEAERIIAEHDAAPGKATTLEDQPWTYGCNMAFRCSAIGAIRFDENLPLYSWQEDVDFSGRIHASGRVARSNAMVGVHRGVTGARTSGVRFGYSQVVNPLYLVRKGTMRLGHAAGLVTRNLIANHIGALKPSGQIDRIGRVKGNWIGIRDTVLGQADPRRILSL